MNAAPPKIDTKIEFFRKLETVLRYQSGVLPASVRESKGREPPSSAIVIPRRSLYSVAASGSPRLEPGLKRTSLESLGRQAFGSKQV